jgi:phage terminase small subunit
MCYNKIIIEFLYLREESREQGSFSMPEKGGRLMPRQADPDRQKAFDIFKEHKGNIGLVDIAKQLGRPPGTIRGWKNKDKWDKKVNGTFQKKKRNRTKKSKKKQNVPKQKTTKKKTIKQISKETLKKVEEENPDLTEKQRLFCLCYVKSFNATMSAIKAGYSKDTACQIGWENLRKPQIAAEIRRLKGTMHQDLFIDAMDVLYKYIEIAFSDVNDYVTYGQKEVQVMGAFGPVTDGEGNPVTKVVNYVDFKSSKEIDGSLIKEVRQGREGISIKLTDKMKALEKLERYFDLLPDKFKRKIEEEKLKMQKQKLEIDKHKADVLPDEDESDDGFMDALRSSVKEVWEDEK